MKLHLGCGFITMDGWLNIDAIPSVDTGHQYLCHDLSRGLPDSIPNESVDFIFHEHFMEHLTREQALVLLKSCRKKLKLGGVMRLTVPDLDELVRRYNVNNIDWGGPGGWQPVNRCVMINQGFHAWGHQFLYNASELNRILHEAGFGIIMPVRSKESLHPELNGLGYRLEPSDLRVEAFGFGDETRKPFCEI